MILYENLPRPTIFAHRGASAHAPENTLAAFQLALDYHAPAIELDTKLSADGEVVVIHDQTVDRTTNGQGAVHSLPLATLRTLDAGASFHPKYIGESIPTLSEVFEAVGHKLVINIEITNYSTPFDDLPVKVAELVKRHALQKSVIFSSFFASNLRRTQRILPEVPRGLLAFAGIQGYYARSWLGFHRLYEAVHPEGSDVTPGLIKRAHRTHRRIHAYTINDPNDMRRLFAWGIDGIFTDDPLLAQQILAESTLPQT